MRRLIVTSLAERELRGAFSYRRCLLPRLPYSFFYTVDEQTIHIVAFLHQHQDATRRLGQDP